MAYKIILHGYADPDGRQVLIETVAKFRVEKVVKVLLELGVAGEDIAKCIEQVALQTYAFKAS